MTGAYILIIMMYFGSSAGSVTTAEFVSVERCEEAAKLVKAAFDPPNRDRVATVCVRK